MYNYFKKLMGITMFFSILFITSCGDSEEDAVVTINPPVAGFDYSFSDANVMSVNFTSTSTSEADMTYAWDFGDGVGTSDQANPTYEYATYGTYTVELTVTNEGGEHSAMKEVTLADPNAIMNGSFDDDSHWTIINHYEETNLNGSVSIANGVALFEETTNTDWKHMGIYQEVTLEAGTYQFEMDVKYADINDVWGEVYLGSNEPAAGSDYGTDQGAELVLKVYNAWDCGDAKTFEGKATAIGCDTSETPGQIEVSSAGTYYLLFRTGGAQYGTDGISIDNLSFVKL